MNYEHLNELIGYIAQIAPHATAIVAIIIPAIQSLKNKRYEIEAERQKWSLAQWTSAYFDFCSHYTKLSAEQSNVELRCELAGHAYKLAAFCSPEGAKELYKFASYVSCGDVDDMSLELLFEQCITVIRQELIEPAQLSQAVGRSSCGKLLSSRGLQKKK